ncbi:MAG: hypothetical protein AAGI11_14795 [Pseudomonadota bacterium]
MRKLRDNRSFPYLAALLLGVLLSTAAKAQVDNYFEIPGSELFTSKDARYGHLRHVGFYGSAMRHWNFTEELAPFTNLTWIEIRNIDATIERMHEARDAGVNVVLSVQAMVFDSDYLLRDDYLFTLSTLRERIDAEGLEDIILMLYPIDEPLHRAANSRATTRAEMQIAIEQVSGDLKTLFPGKPVGVIYGAGEIFRDDFRVSESYDWVGFNCYDNLWDCKGRPITSYYSKLLEVLTPEQMLIAVPETWMKYSDYEREFWESRDAWEKRIERDARNLRKRLRHHYEIALSEPRFVAFIPFIWSMDAPEGRPENSGFGVDRFAEFFPQTGAAFVNTLTDIGRQIKHSDYVYPNLTYRQTEFSFSRPESSISGEVFDVSGRGKISAWAIDSALSHKNLRMQVAIYSEGELLYLSKPKRSFIRDAQISSQHARRLPALSTHGYRHKLPRDIFKQVRGQPIQLELRVLPDRARASDFVSARYDLVM